MSMCKYAQLKWFFSMFIENYLRIVMKLLKDGMCVTNTTFHNTKICYYEDLRFPICRA